MVVLDRPDGAVVSELELHIESAFCFEDHAIRGFTLAAG